MNCNINNSRPNFSSCICNSIFTKTITWLGFIINSPRSFLSYIRRRNGTDSIRIQRNNSYTFSAIYVIQTSSQKNLCIYQVRKKRTDQIYWEKENVENTNQTALDMSTIGNPVMVQGLELQSKLLYLMLKPR